MVTVERTQELELVEVTADAMGWDPSHAWCPWCLKPLWRDNTARLGCADGCADAVDGTVQP